MTPETDYASLFIPCGMDLFQPATALSVITVLKRLNVHYLYHTEQTCCGRRFYMEGEVVYAKELGDKLVKEYGGQSAVIFRKYKKQLPVVVPDCACAGYMKKYYRQLLEYTGIPQDIKTFTRQVYELCDYIVNYKHIRSLGNLFNHRVYYFKSCSARNLYPDNDAPEVLLSNTEGLDLIVSDSLSCCGANGRFSTANPGAADSLASEIAAKAYDASVQYITSTDINCLHQIDAYVTAHDIGIEVIHIADILKGEKPEDK